MKPIYYKSLLAVALLLVCDNVWGESYTITFKVADGNNNGIATSTSSSDIVSEESAIYLTGNVVTANSAYYGNYGLKLGTSSNSGQIKVNLSEAGCVTPTSIVVRAKRYNSDKSTKITLNGCTAQDLTGDFGNYTFSITSKITYLELTSSKGSGTNSAPYCWVESITVNYGNSAPSALEMSTIICTAHSDESLTFGWSEVEHATGYEVTFDDGDPQEITETSYTATALTPNTSYTISVKAIGDGTTYTTSDAETCTHSTDMYAAGPENCLYELSFPDDNWQNNNLSSYQLSWTAIIDSHEWTIANFNNYNWNKWTYIKAGRNGEASVASITTQITESVGRVVVTVDEVTASKINSTKLYVASDATFSENVQEIAVAAAKGDLTYVVPNPTENQYYKLVYDCAKGTSNGFIQISSVKYYDANTQTFSKTISSYKMATLCLSFNAQAPQGVKVYQALADGDAAIALSRVEDGIIPANTGVIVYADVDASTEFTFTETASVSATDFGSNCLKGVNSKTAYDAVDGYNATSYDYYAMMVVNDVVEFCLVEGGSYAANTAYLCLPKQAPVASPYLTINGETTGVKVIGTPATSDVIYDLTGRRVERAEKGIYIVNGKKMYVK